MEFTRRSGRPGPVGGRGRGTLRCRGWELAGLLAAHSPGRACRPGDGRGAGPVPRMVQDIGPACRSPASTCPAGGRGSWRWSRCCRGSWPSCGGSGAASVGMPSDMVLWQDGQVGSDDRRRCRTSIPAPGAAGRSWYGGASLAHPVIDVVEGPTLAGFLGDASRLTRAGAGSLRRFPRKERASEADLPVVDASGRGTKARQWLEAIGAEAPQHEVRPSTRDSPTPPVSARGKEWCPRRVTPWRATTASHQSRADPRRWSAAVGGRHPSGVIVSGLRDDEPPYGRRAVLRRTSEKSLPHPLLHQWMDEAEPAPSAFGYRRDGEHSPPLRPARPPPGRLRLPPATPCVIVQRSTGKR